MIKRMDWLPLNNMIFRADLSKDYFIDAHWALYCENYLEGFHIPFVHGSLDQALSYADYSIELFPFSVLQLGVGSSGTETFDTPSGVARYVSVVEGASVRFPSTSSVTGAFAAFLIKLTVSRPLSDGRVNGFEAGTVYGLPPDARGSMRRSLPSRVERSWPFRIGSPSDPPSPRPI